MLQCLQSELLPLLRHVLCHNGITSHWSALFVVLLTCEMVYGKVDFLFVLHLLPTVRPQKLLDLSQWE